jgi:predicted TIM-barrel fold metal-dependent hydrolase
VADRKTVLDIQVIDTDTHITEPPDLWTSRVQKELVDKVPKVERHPEGGVSTWRIGSRWLNPPGQTSTAGREDYDTVAAEMDEIDPASWQPDERLRRMDEYGVYAQLLYPNIIGFESKTFLDELGPETSTVCTRAYNDFLIDFASVDPRRFLPVTMLPFWDLDASLAEMRRCRDLGHKGILFANKYERIGFPPFTSPHWDPIYAAAQDLEMSINFHVGFAWSRARELAAAWAAGDEEAGSGLSGERGAAATTRRSVMRPVLSQLTNADTITSFLLSDLPDRFPRLKFVSVESGFGFIPYLLESLDWHWKGAGVQRYLSLLPSDYFRRQCYGTFWFERTTLQMLQNYPENFMFSTDFPHPTSLSPGPASPADVPSEHISVAFQDLPDDIVRKALHDNAANIYHLD